MNRFIDHSILPCLVKFHSKGVAVMNIFSNNRKGRIRVNYSNHVTGTKEE